MALGSFGRRGAAVVMAALLAASALAFAQQPATGVSGGMSTAPAGPADQLAAAFAQIGMTRCAGMAQRAANFLFEDGEAAFTVQPLGPDANVWPTVITIESAHADNGPVRFSTVTISPGQGCAGFYEQVIVWPTSCDELARTVFASFTGTRLLLNAVQVSELNAGLQLYLMSHPDGRGCTSIKRELFR